MGPPDDTIKELRKWHKPKCAPGRKIAQPLVKLHFACFDDGCGRTTQRKNQCGFGCGVWTALQTKNDAYAPMCGNGGFGIWP